MKRRTAVVFVSSICILALVGFTISAVSMVRSHFWRSPDVRFGDQYLKTAVALIELHKVRNGSYPESLSDLNFVGEWDRLALGSVTYRANHERTRYCIVVERGWIAKPQLTMPPGFWRGTGYDPSLCR